ncbi:reverse transcriptase domain-containing protein [Tanacetum coccineum]|uniref:Reverse transcriptase domain-containing protein n=1 Tax=Tanacetum coccineum TaxID=301880 RepID=A0ABQ4YA11_9ASTR
MFVLTQSQYAREQTKRADLYDSKPVSTPLATHVSFTADGIPYSDSTLYRSLVGALQYLTITRPDLSYAMPIGLVAWTRVALPMAIQSITRSGSLCLGVPKATTVSPRSSCESEYRAMANIAAENCMDHSSFYRLHHVPPDRPTLLVYNKSALFMTTEYRWQIFSPKSSAISVWKPSYHATSGPPPLSFEGDINLGYEGAASNRTKLNQILIKFEAYLLSSSASRDSQQDVGGLGVEEKGVKIGAQEGPSAHSLLAQTTPSLASSEILSKYPYSVATLFGGCYRLASGAKVIENQGSDEEPADAGSPGVIVYGYDGLLMHPVALPSPDYVPRPEHPPSPDYVPGLEHPPSLVYVPEPEYPEYLVPSGDEAPIEDQPLPADASPTALSSGYIADSDPKEDPEEDHADYHADGGDGDDEPSDDDDDDDADEEDEEASEDEDDDKEKEEHLAPADSSTVPVVNLVPSAGDTEAFETNESAPTPRSPQIIVPPSQTRLRRARKTVRPQTPIPFPSEA